MRPPFRIREIAQQAGLSEATVDRVLHERDGVRKSTIAEVQQAIQDLTRQQSQVRLNGRTFMIDLVIDSPGRFSAEVQSALEQELPAIAAGDAQSHDSISWSRHRSRSRSRSWTVSRDAVRTASF